MKQLTFFLIFIFSSNLYCQKQGSIWYFGDSVGLNFKTNPPTVLTDGKTYFTGCPSCHNEGTSIISDSSGNLLFYSNGVKVWDKTHKVMKNGDSLFGGVSSTQAALIIPLPESSRYFYLFTTSDFQNNLKYGLRYSKIDICLNNGNGDIIEGKKNILLLDTVAEKLTAVKHKNKTDYWIITHKYFSDEFYAYHISSIGIVDTVVSKIGSIHPHPLDAQNMGKAMGQLKASPNGKMLAIVNGNSLYNIAEYYSFDNYTGVVSNKVNLQTNNNYNYYGVSFSPDNSKLYISCILNCNGIFQFDLNAGNGNPDSVIASKLVLADTFNRNFFALQLGIDGKIYVTHSPYLNNREISVINTPNNKGFNCNYSQGMIKFSGKSISLGLPNFMDSYDYSNAKSSCNSLQLIEPKSSSSIINYPNPFNNETTFEIDREFNNGELLIYDLLGKDLKRRINFKNKVFTFYRENLIQGMYYYKLILDTKQIIHGKINILD